MSYSPDIIPYSDNLEEILYNLNIMAVERGGNAPSVVKNQTKRPFSDTQEVYREIYEQKVTGLLNDPESSLYKSIQSEEARIVQHSQSAEGEAEQQGEPINLPISFKIGTSLVPVAMPVDSRLREDIVKNNHNIAQVYLFGEETRSEIARWHNISRQAVRKRYRRAVREMIDVGDIRGGLRFEELNLRKPLSEAARDQILRRAGSVTVAIEDAVKGGADYEDLVSMGFTGKQIESTRKSSAKKAVSVPYAESYRDWSALIAILQDSSTDRSVSRELICDVTRSIYGKYSQDKPGKPALFIDLTNVAGKADLHPNNRRGDISFIADYLGSKFLPIGEVGHELHSRGQVYVLTIHFTLKSCEEEVIRILKQAQGICFDEMRKPPLRPLRALGPVPEKM